MQAPAQGQRGRAHAIGQQRAQRAGDEDFQQPPGGERRQRQKKMRQRQRRRRKAPGQIGIVGQVDRQHRQGRRRGRAEDQRHIHRRQGISQRGIDRQTDQDIEARGDQLEPGGARLIAEPGAEAQHARRVELAERGQAGEEQERHLLQHQPGGEAEAPGIVRDQQVGRRLDRQQERRDPHQPAGRRDQERKAEGEGGVRGRQQHRRGTWRRPTAGRGAAVPAGAIQASASSARRERDRQRDEGGDQGGARRGDEAGIGGEVAPRLQR